MPLLTFAHLPGSHRLTARALFTARALLATTLLPTATFTALTTTAQVAQAQDTADTLFKKGNTLYKGKKWKEAYEAYREAYALEKRYDIAGNLGDVSLTLGKHREAAEYLSHALRTIPDAKAAMKQQVQTRLEQAKKEVGTLSITVNVEGAAVSCNERDVGSAPLTGEVFVEPGATSVVVKAEGHKDARRTVALAKGETKAIEITLETDPNAGAVVPVPGGGTGGASGTEPGNGAGGAGGNGASADANGGVDTDGMSTKTVVVIAGSALTAIGVGVGIGYAIAKGSARDDSDALRAETTQKFGAGGCRSGVQACDDLVDANDRGESASRLSAIGFIGAGVFGAGTLAALLLWPEQKNETSGMTHVGAQPLRGGASFQVSGSF